MTETLLAYISDLKNETQTPQIKELIKQTYLLISLIESNDNY